MNAEVPSPGAGADWTLDQVSLSSGVTVPVRATARRRRWETLPLSVREAIAVRAGSEVVLATSTGTGFTAGFASRLDLVDGRSIFVKAASSGDDRNHGWDLSAAYRVEAHNLRALPPGAGAVPLLWTLELDEDAERWIVLGFPYVAGHPPRRPWRADELRRVTDRLAETAPALEQPPPGLELEPFVAAHAELEGWIARVRERDGDSDWLATVTTLALESIQRCSGSAVAHLDLRDDNLLLGDDGQVWICDWNWPMRAAPWLDLVTVLIAAHGDGQDVDAIVDDHPLTRGVDPRSVDAWLANLWLYFTTRMEDEVPHGSPHLRDHQAWYAEVTQDWLARRIDPSRFVRPAAVETPRTQSDESDG